MFSTMKAVVSNFVIDEVPVPVPYEGEVLVRVHSFGITHNDVAIRSRVSTRQLGVEFSGWIEAFGGEKTAQFRLGQGVFGLAIGGGAYAEFVVCPLETLCPIPLGMSYTDAAGIADMWFSALQVLKYDAELKKRDKILVRNAMSPVGQATVELGQILGCRRIFASVRTKDALVAVTNYLRFRTALPDEVIPLLESPAIPGTVAQYDSEGVAAIVDLRNESSSIADSINMLRRDGRLAIYGVPTTELSRKDLTKIVFCRLKVHGVTFRAREPKFYQEYRDFIVEHLLPKFKNGQLKVRVSAMYDWNNIKAAFDFINRNKEAPGKVICSVVSKI